jgi:hypothetical protein
VPRRKGFANPITVFTNIEQITGYLRRHVARQGPRPSPTSATRSSWVYDIGENSDCSVDALVSDNVADLVGHLPRAADAKASFATKYVNRQLLDLDPRAAPASASRSCPRTTPGCSTSAPAGSPSASPRSTTSSRPATRCTSTSPPSCCGGVGGRLGAAAAPAGRRALPAAKAQAAAEVILLTHNRDLHQVNLGWHPKAEELLWRPDLQQPKRSQNGSWNVRYRNDVKRAGVTRVQELVAAHAPWLRIRYAF